MKDSLYLVLFEVFKGWRFILTCFFSRYLVTYVTFLIRIVKYLENEIHNILVLLKNLEKSKGGGVVISNFLIVVINTGIELTFRYCAGFVV